MSSILYCVIHTQHQDDRANSILSTWGKDKNLLFYSDHSVPEKNIYKVCDQSDYASGQMKQINVFDLLKKSFTNYSWYFFCDNDTFVNTKKLDEYIFNADISSIHGSIINCWPIDRSLYYPSGGAGYLMHYSIFNLMNDLQYNNTQFSDVSIGINFKEKNIKLINSELFKSQRPEFYDISDKDIKKYLSFHYVTEFSMMNHLNLLCSDNN